jgi:hypothetical protein
MREEDINHRTGELSRGFKDINEIFSKPPIELEGYTATLRRWRVENSKVRTGHP